MSTYGPCYSVGWNTLVCSTAEACRLPRRRLGLGISLKRADSSDISNNTIRKTRREVVAEVMICASSFSAYSQSHSCRMNRPGVDTAEVVGPLRMAFTPSDRTRRFANERSLPHTKQCSQWKCLSGSHYRCPKFPRSRVLEPSSRFISLERLYTYSKHLRKAHTLLCR